MTYLGAIKQLHELRNAEDMPFYYKPAIAEVINVLLTDAQEVRRGRWIKMNGDRGYECSWCGWESDTTWDFCPNCGALNIEAWEDTGEVVPDAD